MIIQSIKLSIIASAALTLTDTALAQTSALPGGATTLSETHGDWTVRCATRQNNDKPEKQCALSQEQIDGKTRQRFLAITILPGRNNGDSTASLTLPFGLALDKGVRLSIDERPVMQPERFRTCLPTGCLVQFSLSKNIRNDLSKAKTLKIEASALDGLSTKMTVSLNGFNSALERATNLEK